LQWTTDNGQQTTDKMKNGARFRNGGVTGGWGQGESTDVIFGRLATCDSGPPAPSTEKWRFEPSEKRQLAPFSGRLLAIFSEFFDELVQEGANGREIDAQKR
jgi:hypothetical protein